MHRLRVLKHAAFVRYKALRFPWSVRFEPVHRAIYRWRPYSFDVRDFRSVGLMDRQADAQERTDPVPRIIWCFWTGNNPLTGNRRASLDELRRIHEGSGIEVVLVTPESLPRYIVPESPLHERYNDLHLVHRADYLRAYFLHHHGGGYADIKPPSGSWVGAFQRLDKSAAWLAGDYKPSRHFSPAFEDRRLERLMKWTSPDHLHQIAFLARPRTPLTTEWMAMVDDRLDAVSEELRCSPGAERGGDESYPLAWTAILGRIIDPLTVKYADKVLHDPSMRLSQSDYL